MNKKIENIRKAIFFGECDEFLNELQDALNFRKDHLKIQKSEENRATLKKGDKAELIGSLAPKSIIGLEVEVLKIHRKRVSCKFPVDRRAKRFSGNVVTVPLSNLKVVNTHGVQVIGANNHLTAFMES